MELNIPAHIRNNIYFGNTFQEMIESSIEQRMSTVSSENIITLNNIFTKMDLRNSAIEESLEVMSSPKSFIPFWNEILESSNLSPEQRININHIKKILEDESTSNKESIEGDGEDPNVDNQSGQDPNGGEQPETEKQLESDPEAQQQLSPDQLLQLELTQTDNKFMILTLYDKIMELLNTIEVILENISSSKTEENLDFFETLNMYKNYLNIISELIFVMDLNTVYYNFTNISLEVNDLLDKYLISTKVKVLNDKHSSSQDKENILKDLRNNLKSKIDTNEEIQDEGND